MGLRIFKKPPPNSPLPETNFQKEKAPAFTPRGRLKPGLLGISVKKYL